MVTAAEVVESALKWANITAPGQPVSADLQADGLEALNDLLASWRTQGVEIGAHTLASTSTVPLGDEHMLGLKTLLAAHLCVQQQVPVPPLLPGLAQAGWQGIRNAYLVVPPAPVDAGLLGTPNARVGLSRR